jgi:hypothetical protein
MASLPLTDGTGEVASDVTRNGYNGTVGGTASWATDPTRGTVLSLDGSSGHLELPPNLTECVSDLSFSLWFKTSMPGRVLLSTGNSVIGSSSPSTDEKLYGQFWTGVVGLMVSTSAVDDGGNLWVHGPADGWSYFDGDVSDVEFCDYALLCNGQGDITQFGLPPSAERLSGAAISLTAPLGWGLFLSPDERHPCDFQETLAYWFAGNSRRAPRQRGTIDSGRRDNNSHGNNRRGGVRAGHGARQARQHDLDLRG